MNSFQPIPTMLRHVTFRADGMLQGRRCEQLVQATRPSGGQDQQAVSPQGGSGISPPTQAHEAAEEEFYRAQEGTSTTGRGVHNTEEGDSTACGDHIAKERRLSSTIPYGQNKDFAVQQTRSGVGAHVRSAVCRLLRQRAPWCSSGSCAGMYRTVSLGTVF